jgi:hypothetical protein
MIVKATSLEHALETGEIVDEVRCYSAAHRPWARIASYKAAGKCGCGTPVLILITVRHGEPPAVLHAAVCGERCTDCGRALSAATVSYRGIFGPGWPTVPATGISSSDLADALADGHASPERRRTAAQGTDCS